MLRIGHRGAAGHAVENTLRAIQLAIDLRVDFVEIDVQQLRDGSLVVYHDKLLDRLTNVSGYLGELTYDQVKHLRLVDGPDIIPTLQDACSLVRDSTVGLLVEIITFGSELDALSMVSSILPTQQCIFSSFCHACIANVKQKNSAIKTVALMEGIPVHLEPLIRDTECDYLGLGFESVSANVIQEAKRLGVQVLVWTVDDSREIERARSLGVEGIISNYPERIKK